MASPQQIVDDESSNRTNRIFMWGLSWADYETQLAIRGEEASRPKIAYLDGVMELVSPSRSHEKLKSWIGCLVEAYAFASGIKISAFGEWTQKAAAKQAGAEPDECYIFGADQESIPRPDLVIEVVWTSGGIDKLEIYRRLGIPEVWFWIEGAIQVHALRDTAYEQVSNSQFVPDLDLELLCTFLDSPTMSDAVADFREALRAR